MSYLYKDGSLIKPEFKIYHLSANKSRLYLKLKSNQFLHTKELNDEKFNAKIIVRVDVLNSYESSDLIDSVSASITHFGVNEDKHKLLKHLDLNVTMSSNLLLKITITDVKRQLTNIFYKNMSKSNKYEGLNFHIAKAGNEGPLFGNYVENNSEYHIICSNQTVQKLYVRYYKNTKTLPLPPHSTNKIEPLSYKADSLFIINMATDSTFIFKPKSRGVYHFQINKEVRDGLTLVNFTPNYPKITSIAELVEPLRYITNKDEFIELIESKNKKSSIDKFWISLGKDPTRSKSLIKTYYKRIEKANEMFAAHVEGWRTDRGLIYAVMGPPNSIYRVNNSETWIYGEDQSPQALNFTFIVNKNPFTDNDYYLIRSEAYKNVWMMAVESWRQGRAFNAK
ncbi:MAG: GWxTD domain-containing protein [Flavobacteriales bacterium]|nr:GWxTD domain-containing protein [Flavobacteriales bacterium]